MKHTLGPWFIGKNQFDNNRHVYAAKKIRDEYNELYCPLIAVVNDDEPQDRVDWEANARLIAQAPALLEALEDLLSWDTLAPVESIKNAKAVIKSARGEK